MAGHPRANPPWRIHANPLINSRTQLAFFQASGQRRGFLWSNGQLWQHVIFHPGKTMGVKMVKQLKPRTCERKTVSGFIIVGSNAHHRPRLKQQKCSDASWRRSAVSVQPIRLLNSVWLCSLEPSHMFHWDNLHAVINAFLLQGWLSLKQMTFCYVTIWSHSCRVETSWPVDFSAQGQSVLSFWNPPYLTERISCLMAQWLCHHLTQNKNECTNKELSKFNITVIKVHVKSTDQERGQGKKTA